MDITIIVAVDKNFAIGKNNNLLWHLPNDLKHFKNTTQNGVVIMGRKTYDSIGKALPNRVNVIISKQKDLLIENCVVVSNIEDAITHANNLNYKEIFIIGGAQIYKQSIHICNKLIVTFVDVEKEADVYFPEIDFKNWQTIHEQNYSKDEKNMYDFVIKTFKRK